MSRLAIHNLRLQRLCRAFVVFAGMALVAAFAPTASDAATFLVNSRTDNSDINAGDGVCTTGVLLPMFFPECTLRAAIEEANANSGYDTIQFSSGLTTDLFGAITFIPGTGGLPAITEGVLIDGYTAPTYAFADPWAVPVVHINGSSAGPSASGLTLLAGATSSEIRGIGITNFAQDGIKLGQFAPPEGVTAVTIQGCHIGLFRATVLAGNGDEGIGMVTNTTSFNAVIGQRCNGTTGCSGRGNVISANGSNGITINAQSADVGGNRIGTDAAGSAAPGFGNGGFGIRVESGSSNEIGLFRIVDPGGAAIPVTSGNVISGNAMGGLSVEADATGIYANRIGTDAAGMLGLPNGGPGISLVSDANWIGGEGFASDAGNVISANLGEGIRVGTSISLPSSNNQIRGNRIGVSDGASSALGNGLGGITVSEYSDSNSITSNVVSSNAYDGILIEGDFNFVQRNWFGTNELDDALGNAQTGIRVVGAYNEIGGVDASNVIGFNAIGIMLDTAAIWNDVEGNSIGTILGADIGNLAQGILVHGATNTIGGNAADPTTIGNVIGHNGADGIQVVGLGGSNTWIEGNWIGIDPAGVVVGNGGHGIHLDNSYFNVVGARFATTGSEVGTRGNDVANNAGDGIRVSGLSAMGNAIRGNRMTSNTGLGIELEPAGPTPNDPDDSDVGPNELQNYPVLDAGGSYLEEASGALSIRFKVDGDPTYTSLPIAVDFYVADAQGQEGLEWIGAGEVPLGELGVYRSALLAAPASLLSGGYVVATATNSNNTGSTSEFSPSIPVPEPDRIVLLAAGLAVLCALKRRAR